MSAPAAASASCSSAVWRGAATIVHARKAEQVGSAAVALQEETGAPIESTAFDVTDTEQVDVTITASEAAGSPIDVLVANTGMQLRAIPILVRRSA